MARRRITATARINAPAPVVCGTLADYHRHHPRIFQRHGLESSLTAPKEYDHSGSRVVDDHQPFLEYLATFLRMRGYEVRGYSSGPQIVGAVRAGSLPDLVLLDVMMPGMDGLDTLRTLKEIAPSLPVIMLSARNHASTVVEAVRLGALDYLVKPDNPEGLAEIALEAAVKAAGGGANGPPRSRPRPRIPDRRRSERRAPAGDAPRFGNPVTGAVPAMPLMRALAFVCLVLAGHVAASAWQASGWRANPSVVERTAKSRPQFNYDEAKVPPYALPDVLGGGTPAVTTPAAWAERRRAVLELFRENVYGRSPGRPGQLRFDVVEETAHAMDGAATLKRVAVVSTHEGREHRFTLTLFLPNGSKQPVPLFILLNNRPSSNTDPSRAQKSGFWPAEEVIAHGYGIAALQVSELAPDDKDRFRDGVIRLFEGSSPSPRAANAWAGLAAWAWGASRAMDYFESDRRIDAKRIALAGHSRGGKAALWAGAEDERFAIVISNESGEGGAALSRRHFGETTARITESFPHWFAGRYGSFAGRERELPVDQHMLVALAAPRAVYVASADEDLWSDPRGEFLALAHASPVFALWGDAPIRAEDMPPLDRPLVVGRRGYHVRTGGHDLTPYDWARFMDFADAVFNRK